MADKSMTTPRWGRSILLLAVLLTTGLAGGVPVVDMGHPPIASPCVVDGVTVDGVIVPCPPPHPDIVTT